MPLEESEIQSCVGPRGGAIGALNHAVIHGLDITSALGIDRTCDDDACCLVLDSLAIDAGTLFGMNTSGQLLRASDLEWEHGAGEPVTANAADLILALAGRTREGIELATATP